MMKTTRKTDQVVQCAVCGTKFSDGETQTFVEINRDKGGAFHVCRKCVMQMAIEARLGRSDGFSFYDEDVGARPEAPKAEGRSLSPAAIKAQLDQYVIGQDSAKKIVATAYCNHVKRTKLRGASKSNVLLIGDTGTGKTLIAEHLAKAVDVPFVIEDASRYTKKGYVGGDVDDILEDLYEKSGNNKDACERGIVYLDECDKLCFAETDGVGGVGGRAVQNELLKLVEGSEVTLRDGTRIKTKGILFIAGGAFSGLDEIIRQNSRKSVSMGFNVDGHPKEERTISSEDLISYGLSPEFVGRFPVVARLSRLTENELVRVLRDPKDSICKEFEDLFRMDGVSLSFEDDALRFMARAASKDKVGARRLRGLMEEALLEEMFASSHEKNKKICLVYDLDSAKIRVRNINHVA